MPLKGKLQTLFLGYTSVMIVFLISGSWATFSAQDKAWLYVHSVGLGILGFVFVLF